MGDVPTPIGLDRTGWNCNVGCIRISLRDLAQNISLAVRSRIGGNSECRGDSQGCHSKWRTCMARHGAVPNAAI